MVLHYTAVSRLVEICSRQALQTCPVTASMREILFSCTVPKQAILSSLSLRGENGVDHVVRSQLLLKSSNYSHVTIFPVEKAHSLHDPAFSNIHCELYTYYYVSLLCNSQLHHFKFFPNMLLLSEYIISTTLCI